MRTLIFYALLCLVFSCTANHRISQVPAIHTADFEAFYQDSTNRATITGRIINLPGSLAGKRILKFSPVSIQPDLQPALFPDIAEDGRFQLRLPENYPAQEIFLSINKGQYFGSLLVRESLSLEINYAELTVPEDPAFSSIKAIQYSGPDAALTEASNRINFASMNGKVQDPLMGLMGVITNPERKLQELDSLMVLHRASDEKLAVGLSKRDLLYIRNQRETQYLGLANFLYSSKTMPASFRKRYLEHQPLAMSNATSDFYQYFFYSLYAEAYQKVIAVPDSTETELGRNIRVVDSLMVILDTEFAPQHADLFKLCIHEKDPNLNAAVLERSLQTAQTSWIRTILQERSLINQNEIKRLNQVLSREVPKISPIELGRSEGTLDFGARLDVVNEKLSGEELLAKIRGAFPDKTLYLDFWATWCGPCIAEMPFSAKLHRESEGLPVEYIYLCTEDGGSIEQWQNLIANHEVGGTHLFVPKAVHKELMNLFSARGYPTYVLLEADGTPNLDVARPRGLNRKLMIELLGKE